MIDAREAVAKETAERWLGKTFAVPMTLRSEVMAEAQAERARDIREAILDALPRIDRAELLDRCEAARKQITRQSKAMTWPTPKEVLDAFRETAPKAESGPGGDRAAACADAARNWIEKFNEWPEWLSDHRGALRELERRGEMTAREAARVGFPRGLLRREEWTDDAPCDPGDVRNASAHLGDAKRWNAGDMA